ncbi:2-polyprenyl-6-methoxyphenol hydroxylase [Dyadobacter soli]|uniref:2-polyprenyl-6-methoxyphenol hydroxylase n=1 Tax=Dyadobacter soli TaxID=659014 RepID=A0A1G7T2L5_9BACT|nr:FAD-dependent monooxygenase [Dyadobacter soli]SDG29491.1 2-polyprenyl-6-methoxyphenol hydroxylase [Dyadobacter soli]
MKITITGAGIAGLCAAIAFTKAGYETTVFEAAPTIMPVGAGLGLAPNAINALAALDIADDIIPLGRRLPYFRILDRSGKVISENNSDMIGRKFGLDNFTIHRRQLHNALLSEVDPASIHAAKKAVGLENDGSQLRLHFADGTSFKTDYLIVADGINSVIRQQVAPNAQKRYAGYTCWRGVIDNAGALAEGASETWDTTGRFGIVPLPDDQLYWFACVAADANDARYGNFVPQNLAQHFRHFHTPVPEILARAHGQALLHHDIYDLAPLEHYAYGNVLLIGDAAHCATPNMGQGACQAIEDAATLYTELCKDVPLENAFIAFEKRRLERTQYIISQSRKIGSLAQIGNPLLASLRNTALRLAPASLREKQFEKLYNVTF